MKKIEDTYLFNDSIGANRINNEKYKRDNLGNKISYDKDSVVNIISKYINNGQILKGMKIDNKTSDYISYVFKYKAVKNDEDVKCTYRIKIPKKYMEENRTYINRLDYLVKSTSSIIKVNMVKNIIIASSLSLVTSSIVVGSLMDPKNDSSISYQQEILTTQSDNLIQTREDFLEKNNLTIENLKEWNPDMEEIENKNLR